MLLFLVGSLGLIICASNCQTTRLITTSQGLPLARHLGEYQCAQQPHVVSLAYEALLYEAAALGLVPKWPPTARPSVCLVDASSIECGYSRPLAGCSSERFVAVALRAPGDDWRRTLLHELYCSLALSGSLQAPQNEQAIITSPEYKIVLKRAYERVTANEN